MRTLANVMISIIVLVVCFALGEVATRIFAFDKQLVFELDEQLYWVFRPNQEGFMWMGGASFRSPDVRINNLGLRGRDISPDTGDVIRVLTLGDSYTFGSGVRDEETFSAVLEHALGDKYLRARVVNAGVPGYGVFQAQRMLERLAPLLRPRVVIVTIPTGDIVRQPFEDVRAERAYLESERRRMALRNYSQFGTFLYRQLYYINARLRGNSRAVPNETVSSNKETFHLLWLRDQDRLTAMAETCKRIGASLVVMAWPQTTQDPQWNSDLLRGIHALATRDGIVGVVELDHELAEYPGEQLVIPGDGHPSIVAHRVAGLYLTTVVRPIIERDVEELDPGRDSSRYGIAPLSTVGD